MSTSTSLQNSVLDRKARLAALKSKSLKRKEPDPDTTPDAQHAQNEEEQTEDSGPSTAVTSAILSGRNYDPETRGPKLGFEHNPASGAVTLEQQAAALAAQAKQAEEEAEAEKAKESNGGAEAGLDLFQLRPKKPNWDLKRELAERQRVLNLRTENAIARLVRERIAGQKGNASGGGLEGSDLAEAVRVREIQAQEEERREKELEEEE